MREMLIKTATSPNHKRKNMSMVEIIEEKGYIAKAEKKYSYYVSEQDAMPDPNALKTWMDQQTILPEKKARHVSIRRVYDKDNGMAEIIYRVIGSFYVVQELRVFAVVFMHSIRFHLITDGAPGFK